NAVSTVQPVAAPVPTVLVGCRCEASQAAAATTREDCQVLQGICECVPDRTPLPPAELVSPFAVQVWMLVFLPLRFSCGPLSPVTGTSRRPPEAEEKVDFRDELRAFGGRSLSRYITTITESRSVRPRLVSAG